MKFIKNLFEKIKQRKREKAEKELQKDMEMINYIEEYQREHPDVDVIYKGERFH